MEKADRVSRRLDWKVRVEKYNESQTLIKEQWIHNLSEVVIEGLEVDIVEKIKITRSKDKEVVKVVEEMKKTEVKVLWRFCVEREKGICAKGWSIESRDNPVTSWYTSSRTWR